MRKQQQCKQWAAVVALVLGAGLAAPAAAIGSFGFSQASSDTTPAGWLGATLTTRLIDNQTFEMSVRNDTAGATAFDIQHVFFNVGGQMGTLNLVEAVSSVNGSNTGDWSVGDYGYERTTAYFGNFDQSLRTVAGASADQRIAPGETQSFTLRMDCSYGLCNLNDLLSNMSTGGYGEAYAAIRFAYGPGGDAAFGALTQRNLVVAPEPTTAVLLVGGLLAMGAVRGSRRQ